MWGGVVHEQRILNLTHVLHVSAGLQKLHPKGVTLGHPKVCSSAWREGGAVSDTVPLSSPFRLLSKSTVVRKSMVKSCRIVARPQRWLGGRCEWAQN